MTLRTRVLVMVLAALGAIRFILIPWWQHQVSMREELDLLTKRYERSASVVANRQLIEESERKITASLGQLRPMFAEFAAVEPFQLDAQQKINQIAASHSVRLNVFAWVLDEPVAEGVAHRVRARMLASGKMGDLAVFQAELETRFPSSSVVESNLISSGEMGVGNAGSLTVVMDFFFLPIPAQAAAGVAG